MIGRSGFNDDLRAGSQAVKNKGLAVLLHLDLPLLTALLILCGFGLVILYSASGENMDMVYKQSVRLGIAFVAMLMVAQIPPQQLRRWSPLIFGIGVVLLIAVLVAGHVGMGARRWLNFGFFRFQPSEVMKLALPMMLAWFVAQHDLPPRPLKLVLSAIIMIIPVALIIKQPDLGTSILVASAGIFVLFLGGLSWKIIAGMFAVAGAAAPLAWSFLHPYQQKRVLTMLDPQSDPLGAGYHIIQSKIAIGSGGMYGKGWLNGTQSHLEFLPERHTDFIFSVFAEEFGLMGVVPLLLLYLFIIYRGLYIAGMAQDNYSRLLGGSLILVFFVYLFVNTGMISGMLPVVGVPLPLVSYGGTSLVTIMAGFGILMSIHSHKKMLPP